MGNASCSSCGKPPTDYLRRGKCWACYWIEERERVPCSSCGGSTGYALGVVEVATCNECRRNDWEHGTRKGYRERGCRCEECRQWNRDRRRQYAADYRERTGKSVHRKYQKFPERGSDWISPKVRAGIYERDGWACWLCGDAIDRTLHANDEMAPSLDHVVPRSATPTPNHSPDNLRTAHRGCNARRWTRPAPTGR